MKFRDWVNTKIPVNDIICGCTDPTGLDADNFIYPLGCHMNFNKFKKNNDIGIFTNHPEINTKLLFYNYRTDTDSQRTLMAGFRALNFNKVKPLTRIDFKINLDKYYRMKGYGGDEYFKNLGKYKFVISPPGNGIDCYRNYETWLSKGIPIIPYNNFIAKKYSTLPILWTQDYSEINDEYLNKAYKGFLDKEYDFRRVLLTKYNRNIQREIAIVCANCPSNHRGMRSKQFWKYSDFFKNKI